MKIRNRKIIRDSQKVFKFAAKLAYFVRHHNTPIFVLDHDIFTRSLCVYRYIMVCYTNIV